MNKSTPEMLRKAVQEARKREAQAVLRAESIEKDRLKFNADANKECNKFEKESVHCAISGVYFMDYLSPNVEIASFLQQKLLQAQFDVDTESVVSDISDLCRQERDSIKLWLSNSADSAFAQNHLEIIASSALSLINDIESLEIFDDQISTNSSYDTIVGNNKDVIPADFLHSIVQISKNIDSLISRTKGFNSKCLYRVSWANQDWRGGCKEELFSPHILNWVSSGTGQAFFANVSKAFDERASAGFNTIALNHICLGVNAIRWGENLAYKVVTNEMPLGILPFQPTILAKVYRYLGFKTSISQHHDIGYDLQITW